MWGDALRSLILCALLFACSVQAQAMPAAVEAHVVHAPQPVMGSDGLRHMAYELDITNFYGDTGVLKLSGVTVYAESPSAPLASFSGAGMAALLAPNTDLQPDNSLAIKVGGHAVIFLWLTLPKDMPLPDRLRHHLDFKTEKGVAQTADDVFVPVSKAPPVVIGPPLRGLWLADEGPGYAQSHHWGSLVAENGRLTIPQRYAIDFFGADAKGHAVRVPVEKLAESRLEDWVGFDSEVLAVVDGVVRQVQDGIPDHKPLSQSEPSELTPEALYGNFVILEIAPHVFAHYAHLRAGSVKVKAGDHVRRGDILAHLGDTGSAGAPHLHFHVSDTMGFAGSEGLPFVFDNLALAGHASESEVLNNGSNLDLTAGKIRHDSLPLNGDLVAF